MARRGRLSALRLATAYTVLSLCVLSILAVPLWYAWRQNIENTREQLIREDAEATADIQAKLGNDVLVRMIEARVANAHLGNLVISLANARAQPLAGNIAAWPAAALRTDGMFKADV